MKNIISILFVIALASCGKKQEPKEPLYPEIEISSTQEQVATGKELFNRKGNCAACHQSDQRIIGPSIIEIASIYRDQKADMVEFLKGNGEPIVAPEQFEIMKTNFAITKKMSDAELKAIEAYMYSHLK